MKKESKTITAVAKRMLTGKPLNLTIAEKVAIRKWKFNQMPLEFRKNEAYQRQVAADIERIKQSL